MNKKIIVPALLAAGAIPSVSHADLSANVGWVSDYIFRGVYQEDSSPYAGFDWASDAGFYAGTWGADVGDGLETDLYGGWSGGGDNFTFKAGFTVYRYFDDFDGDYDEINLGAGFGIFTLDAAVGQYEPLSGGSLDYTYASVTIAPEVGPYYKLAGFAQDFDGNYFEVGYTFDFMGVDLSIAATYSPDAGDPGSSIVLREEDFGRVVAPGDDPYSEYALVFGIKKAFSIGE